MLKSLYIQEAVMLNRDALVYEDRDIDELLQMVRLESGPNARLAGEVIKYRLTLKDTVVKQRDILRGTKEKLISMVNSLANMLIDSSSKGYVSGDDLDYANDCLGKIVPASLWKDGASHE
jgi:hypothetical protein